MQDVAIHRKIVFMFVMFGMHVSGPLWHSKLLEVGIYWPQLGRVLGHSSSHFGRGSLLMLFYSRLVEEPKSFPRQKFFLRHKSFCTASKGGICQLHSKQCNRATAVKSHELIPHAVILFRSLLLFVV